MNKSLIIILLFISSCYDRKDINGCYLSGNLELSEIIGVWQFKHSCNNVEKVELNDRWYIGKIEFLNFNLNNLKARYTELNDARKSENLLRNIIVRTYHNNDILIDDYIPIAEKINDALIITIYGTKTKNELRILQVDKEKMVLTDGKVWEINGKKLTMLSIIILSNPMMAIFGLIGNRN